MNLEQTMAVWWEQLQTWLEAFIAGLPQLLAAIAILGFFWYLSKKAQKLLLNLFNRVEMPVSVERLLASLVRIAIVILGVMLALGILNLDKTVTSLLAGLGIVGVALGFAFQDIASNFISGLILVIRRPFNVGDVISVSGEEGIVTAIELRSTIMKSFQGQIVHIPNQKVFSDVITNYSELGQQRVDLSCGVGYQDPLAEVQKFTLETIKSENYVLSNPKPTLLYDEFGGSSINFKVRFWINYGGQIDYLEAQSKAIIAITELYKSRGYSIPFPITAIDITQQKAQDLF